MDEQAHPTIGIVGGTGDLGSGLARRWAKAGYRVLIGSRRLESAQAAAEALAAQASEGGWERCDVEGMENSDAAAAADLVVVTVPFSSQVSTLQSIAGGVAGKIVVDVTVPLVPPKVARVQMPSEGSAGQIAQATLGEDVMVVSAFRMLPPRTSRPMIPSPAMCWSVATARKRARRSSTSWQRSGCAACMPG